jgi:hypothetical protein
MRRQILWCLAVLWIGLASLVLADDDTGAAKAQKAAAYANWKRIFGNEAVPTSEETTHLLLFASAGMTEKQVKDLGTALETQYGTAFKALKLESKDALWNGKLSVYLLDERRQFNSFMRLVAKQRPESDETGTFVLRNDAPFIAAGPPQGKTEASMIMQVGEQLGAAMLSKVAGESLPDWVAAGFGRATVWRAAPYIRPVKDDRSQVRRLVTAGRRTAADVWGGTLKADEAIVLRASLLDYLAYGPGSRSFAKFIEGYLPDEGVNREKTTAEALKFARISPEGLDAGWRAWAAGR